MFFARNIFTIVNFGGRVNQQKIRSKINFQYLFDGSVASEPFDNVASTTITMRAGVVVMLIAASASGAIVSPKRRRELHQEAVRKFEESAERQRERARVTRVIAWLETAVDHILSRSHTPMRTLSAHEQLVCGCELDSLRPIAYGATVGAECVRAEAHTEPGWDERCGTVCLHATGREIVQFCPQGFVANCTSGCVRAPVEKLEERAAAVEARALFSLAAL